MPNPLIGLQVAEMGVLIATCRKEAASIRTTVATLTTNITSTWWKGHDADTFRSQWSDQHRPRSLQVAQELEDLATYLQQQVARQIATSGL
jgi:hypothetical protein